MMLFRVLAVAALFVFGLASAAKAAPVTYTINGTFNGGPETGTYSGTFTYDATADIASNVAITLSGGLSRDGTTVLPPTLINTSYFATDSTLILLAGPVAAGQRGIVLQILPDFASPAPLVVSVREGRCSVANCSLFGSPNNARRDSTNAVLAVAAPVPTVTEWAMMALALLLATMGLWQVRRQRLPA